MKFTFTFLLFLFISIYFSFNSSAQKLFCSAKTEEFQGLKDATFYYIKSDIPEIDDSLYSAIKKYWKIGKVKRLSQEKLDEHLGDPTQYFICCAQLNDELKIIKKNPNHLTYFKLMLFSGKYKSLRKYKVESDIIGCSDFPINTEELCNYNFDFAAKTLNQIVKIDLEKQIDARWINITAQIVPEINKNAIKVKDKTLLILKSSVSVLLKEKVLETYQFKYKIVTDEELIAILNEGSDEYCLLQGNVNSARAFIIYDISTKKLLCMTAQKKYSMFYSKTDIADLCECIKTCRGFWFVAGALN